jgi:hypothetical protein
VRGNPGRRSKRSTAAHASAVAAVDGPSGSAGPAPSDATAPEVQLVADAPLFQVGSALLFLLLLTKAYAVAGFSLTTTGELIATAPLAVLLGTIASYAYVALPLLFVISVGWLRRQENRDLRWQRIVAWAVLIVSLVLSPLEYLIAVSLGALLWTVVGRRVLLWMGSARPVNLLVTYVVAVLVGFLLLTMERPWVPAEVLELRSAAIVSTRLGQIERDDRPVVYVLKSDSWITALNADTRFVMHISSSNVLSRTICHHDEQLSGSRPLLYYVLGRSYRSPNTACENLTQARDP